LTGSLSDTGGIIIDDTGNSLPLDPAYLAQLLDCPTHDFDVIAYAVRSLGFVQVAPVRDALLVKFEPTTISRLAAIGAFCEVARRAPKRLILACSGAAGVPDRYEIFLNLGEGLRQLEAALESREYADRGTRPYPGQSPAGRRYRQPSLGEPGRGGRIVTLRRPDGVAIRRQAKDVSKRLLLPVDAIAPEDKWLGRLVNMWRKARPGWYLPASEALDPLEVLNIARGRAHIVDTTAADPSGYRFRIWGAANSYGINYGNQTLAQMPASLMREDALEDYWEVVMSGEPTYQLIQHMENGQQFSYARLLLPLAADGLLVDQLLVLFNERTLPELGAP
jgi:hypothetical protein